MKANLNTFKQALELTCKAHRGARLEYYPEEGQFGIMDCSVPLITDVNRICTAFFGTSKCVEGDFSWGVTTIYLDSVEFLPEVNIETLNSALPFEWYKQIKD